MTRNLENLVTFASPTMMKFNMETITLSYEPGSDFAKALDELIRNSEGVRVVKKKCEKEEQMKAFDKELSAKDRNAVYRLAESVKKRVKEVNDAAKDGGHVGRDADEFLSELLKEQS